MTGRRLNLGCGEDVRAGWVNLDVLALPGVDVVFDLDSGPLPFEDASFEAVDCFELLEHVADHLGLLAEVHRVLRPGGRLRVQAPHFTSRNAHLDPTHRRAFSVDTLRFCVRGDPFARYAGLARYAALESARITFDRDRMLPGTLGWSGS